MQIHLATYKDVAVWDAAPAVLEHLNAHRSMIKVRKLSLTAFKKTSNL